MKRLVTALAFVVVLGFIGCANEGPTSDELQEKIGRGMRGEGQLSTDIDRSDDRYVRPREGGPLPSE